MVTQDDVIKFFNAYLDADHAGNVAAASQSDEEVKRCREASSAYFYSGDGVIMTAGFGRPAGWPQERIDELAQRMNTVRRPLLLVAEYTHATWGSVFAGYIGGDRPRTSASYGGLVYAAAVQGELKIVASFREDFGKPSPPVRWTQTQGIAITGLAGPVSVRALQAPTNRSAHLEDWEALRDTATH